MKYNLYKPSTLSLNINSYDVLPNNVFTATPFWFSTFLKSTQVETVSAHNANQDVTSNFLFIRQSTITAFFAVNMIDMPLCFKKSKSLYSTTFELPTLKLSNMLMRDGNREKIFRNLTLSLNRCFFTLLKTNSSEYTRWSDFYSNLVPLQRLSGGQISSLNLSSEVQFLGKHTLTSNTLHLQSNRDMMNLLLTKIRDFLPLFSFYIRKVDKSIRKHSRGKSGKYTIIWKYIPSYKRLFVTMRWFLKDLKFQKARHLDARLYKTIETFFLSPELSFVAKLRRFSHFFVFHNYKKTLMRSLKSAS